MTQKFVFLLTDGRKQFSKTMLFCITVLLCFSSAVGDRSMNYKEVEKLGSSCPRLDSCAYQGALSRRQQAQIKERNCNCDYLCSEYGDCCVDALWATRSNRNDLKCHHLEQIGGVYMKDSCPFSYKGSDAVKTLCETTKLGDQADPLASIPVTDPMTGMTYKNFYCNLCNGNTNNIVMWTPKLECPLLSLMNKSHAITSDYVLENLASDGHNWGLYLNDESDGSVFFHDCYVYTVIPAQLERMIRRCKADLISSCSPSWDGGEVQDMCKSYTGARFDANGKSYRNVHCAVCNGVNTTKLSCRSIDEIDIFRDFGLHSFALLLDVSEGTGEEVGKIRICKRGEVFDPFFKKCRSVLCLPGFVRRGRRCVMRNRSEFAKFYSASNKKSGTVSTTPKQQDARKVTLRLEDRIPTPISVNATLHTV